MFELSSAENFMLYTINNITSGLILKATLQWIYYCLNEWIEILKWNAVVRKNFELCKNDKNHR